MINFFLNWYRKGSTYGSATNISTIISWSHNFDLSTDTFSYVKTFVNARYITFIKNDFPNPALCVKIYATILFLMYVILICFWQSVLPDLKYYWDVFFCCCCFLMKWSYFFFKLVFCHQNQSCVHWYIWLSFQSHNVIFINHL